MSMMFHKKKSLASRMLRLILIAGLIASCFVLLWGKPISSSTYMPTKHSPTKAKVFRQHYLIQKGDNVSILFKKAGIAQANLQTIMKDPKNTPLLKLHPGRRIILEQSSDHVLIRLNYDVDDQTQLHISKDPKGYQSSLVKKQTPQYNHTTLEGSIEQSLYLDAKAKGIPLKIIMEFSKALGWQVNEKNLKQGDSFAMTYETGKNSIGHLLAGQLQHRGKTYQVYCPLRHGKRHCYDAKGHSTEAKFLRLPLKNYKRISDPFNPKRQHPVLKTIRPHWGTDFAAPYKTPVHATAEGTVAFIGRRGGFGNFIELHHGQGYTTRYAHMAKFATKLKKGSHVKQDQVIGYVGNTGLSTGNHLHYEIRIHDKAYNPMTVTLPGKTKLTGNDLEQLQDFIASIYKKH